MLPDTVPFVDG